MKEVGPPSDDICKFLDPIGEKWICAIHKKMTVGHFWAKQSDVEKPVRLSELFSPDCVVLG